MSLAAPAAVLVTTLGAQVPVVAIAIQLLPNRRPASLYRRRWGGSGSFFAEGVGVGGLGGTFKCPLGGKEN